MKKERGKESFFNAFIFVNEMHLHSQTQIMHITEYVVIDYT